MMNTIGRRSKVWLTVSVVLTLFGLSLIAKGVYSYKLHTDTYNNKMSAIAATKPQNPFGNSDFVINMYNQRLSEMKSKQESTKDGYSLNQNQDLLFMGGGVLALILGVVASFKKKYV